MNFLIQNDAYIGNPPWAYIDANILKERLIHRYVDGYREVSYNDILLMPVENIKDEIPVGSIPFVETWLKRVHGIERINPIEIPKFLRTKEFVKRDYQIVPYEDVPKTGKYFVKDVSVSKKFSFFVIKITICKFITFLICFFPKSRNCHGFFQKTSKIENVRLFSASR